MEVAIEVLDVQGNVIGMEVVTSKSMSNIHGNVKAKKKETCKTGQKVACNSCFRANFRKVS